MKKLLTSLVLSLALLTANSQTVTISPLPQKITWGEEAFSGDSKFYLVGAEYADSDAIKLLSEKLEIIGVSKKINAKKFPSAKPIVLGEKGDKAVAKYIKSIPERNEAYYLEITPDHVIVAGAF